MVKLKEGLGYYEWDSFMSDSIRVRNAHFRDAATLWVMLKTGVSEDVLKVSNNTLNYKEIWYKGVKYLLPIEWCLPIFEWG